MTCARPAGIVQDASTARTTVRVYRDAHPPFSCRLNDNHYTHSLRNLHQGSLILAVFALLVLLALLLFVFLLALLPTSIRGTSGSSSSSPKTRSMHVMVTGRHSEAASTASAMESAAWDPSVMAVAVDGWRVRVIRSACG